MNPFRSSEYGEFPCIENPVLLKYIALDVISGRKIPSLSILNVDLIPVNHQQRKKKENLRKKNSKTFKFLEKNSNLT